MQRFWQMMGCIVFENLIGNAVKHGKASRIEVDIQKSENGVRIRIADDGKGIPVDVMDKISEEGFTTGSGSGLGLYIVKKLVESFGGSIKVERSVPRGTVFVLEFPRIVSLVKFSSAQMPL